MALNLAERVVLHFFYNYAELYKERSTKKSTATSNAENLKEKSLKH